MALACAAGCGSSGTSPNKEPTEQDAIYDIIRYDAPQAFDLDSLDFSIPDTSSLLAAPFRVVQFWRHLGKDSLFISIALRMPQAGDSVGTVPQASVTVQKFFWGTLEIIAIDTTNGGQEPVRLTKPFNMEGYIDGFFERLGRPENTRRGWRLRKVSDAIFGSPSGQIRSIEIDSDTGFVRFAPIAVTQLSDIILFDPGDSVTIRVETLNTEYYVTLRYPSTNRFISQRLEPDSSGEYVLGFRMPNSFGYGHFIIDAISKDAVTSNLTTPYNPAAVGVLFRLPWPVGKIQNGE